MFCFSPIPPATSSDQCMYWLGSTVNIDDDDENDDYRYYDDCNSDDEYDDNNNNNHVNVKNAFNNSMQLMINNVTPNRINYENAATTSTVKNGKMCTLLIEIVGAMRLKATIQQQQQQQQQQHSNSNSNSNNNGNIQRNLSTNQSSKESNNNSKNKTLETKKDSTNLQQEPSTSSSWLSLSFKLLDAVQTYSKSVTNLTNFTSSNSSIIINSYCIVKWNGSIIHQTSIIKNDSNPIWTVRTKSLCMITIPEELCTRTSTNLTNTNNMLTIEVYNSSISSSQNLLGIVTILGDELWNNCTSERIEYPIISNSTRKTTTSPYRQTNIDIPLTPTSHTSSKSFQYPYVDSTTDTTGTFNTTTTSNIRDNVKGQVMTPKTTTAPSTITSDYSNYSTSNNTSLLALRFRVATDNDIIFMKQLNSNTSTRKININNTSSVFFTNSNRLLSSTYTSTKQKHNALHTDNDNDINALITATDINFTAVNFRSIQDTMKSSSKIVTMGSNNSTVSVQQKLYRVKPGPDPKQVTSGNNNTYNPTEWMTKEEIQKECMKQSITCISVNDGQCGTVFLEILQCTNLPNLDSSSLTNIAGNVTDKNDTFVCIVCEESMVRTTILWDSNNPYWMPWTTRSFAFNIHHPSSLLFLGVFDYDSTIIDYHDPIGRVVINITNFEPNVSYILQYNLQHDIRMMNNNKSNSNNSRGTIKIRLRIAWNDDCASIIRKSCQVPSQRYIINVDNDKSYQVLRYLTRGYIDMDTPSIDTVQLYGKELINFGKSYLYVLDVIVGILLWRGRVCTSNGNSIWFPIQSVALFIAAISIIEYPAYIIPILLYYHIWILGSINYQTSSRYITKWIRTKSFSDITYRLLFGWPSTKTIQTNLDDQTTENEVAAEHDESRNEKLYELKQRRVGTIVIEFLLFVLQIIKIYNKTSDFAIQITTNQQDWLHIFNDRFYYLHLILKLVYTIIHQLKNFCTSQNSVTCLLSIKLFCIATIWLLFPINFILLWSLRICVWIVFGPLMKIIDIHIFQSWYRTDEELLQLIDTGLSLDDIGLEKPNFDPVLESKVFHRLIHAGRIKAEELYKMKDIREVMFGKYSESIPMKDTSFYPSIPLPSSYGTIYTGPNSISTSTNATNGMNSNSRYLDVQAAAISTEGVNTRGSNNMRCAPSYYLPGQSLHGTMIPTQLFEQQSDPDLNNTKFKNSNKKVIDTTTVVDNNNQKEKAD